MNQLADYIDLKFVAKATSAAALQPHVVHRSDRLVETQPLQGPMAKATKKLYSLNLSKKLHLHELLARRSGQGRAVCSLQLAGLTHGWHVLGRPAA